MKSGTSIPLDDTWIDVLSKAVHGIGTTPCELSERINLSKTDLEAVLKWKLPSSDVLDSIAVALDLNPNALYHLAWSKYQSQLFDGKKWPGVVAFSTSYFDISGNAFLIWDTQTKEAILFDTGTDFSVIIKVGQLAVHVLQTDGHCQDHLSFVVYSPQWTSPLAVVGDTLFARSAGRAQSSYSRLRSHIRNKILALPSHHASLSRTCSHPTVAE